MQRFFKRLLCCLAAFMLAASIAHAEPVTIQAFGDDALDIYFTVAGGSIPWTLLAAIDAVEWARYDLGGWARIARLPEWLQGETLEQQLACYGGSASFHEKVKAVMASLTHVEAVRAGGLYFPLGSESGYVYENNWGALRTYGGSRAHLGIDIIVDKGTPIKSICAGTVTRKGWDEKGGWRVGVTDENGLYYYYAHMSAYADVQIGDVVAPGTVLGFVGSTGYGPEGTDSQMIPHLHIGLYEDDVAVSPYAFLRAWERGEQAR